jgi:hypothetical protein
MTIPIISHSDVATFAETKVNLRQKNASKLRKQANDLRDKLDRYISEHPEFALKRMMLSGSLAKSTALATTSDIDVALYVANAEAPETDDLAEWLVTKLRAAYPNKDPDDIQPQRYSVCIKFRGTGLDIDVVPILYDGNLDWDGQLVNKHDGTLLTTNIPRQLEFFKKRKDEAGSHNYRQVIRLLKYWSKQRKAAKPDFRCKSFLIELLVAHLYDRGKIDVDNYPLAMRQFFDALGCWLLRDRISFNDYYADNKIPESDDLIQVIDPVNPNNNVTGAYGTNELNVLEQEALAASDAIVAAEDAPTKQEALDYWRSVLSNSFSV